MGLTEKTFRDGEIIIKEGDNGTSFFRLLEGNAGVYAGFGKNDQIKLAVLNAGEYFGEMAILEAYPRSATVVAKGSARVVEIPGDELKAYFTANPDQIIELMRYLGNRVQTMTKDYNDSKLLLDELRQSDAAKKDSLFSKIKKHIDVYQSNKNKLAEPDTSSLKEELEKIKGNNTGNIKAYNKGIFIFREGDFATSMDILHSGEVGLYTNYRHKDELKINSYSAVAVFGEMGMIAEEPRNATAVADSENVRAEIINQEDLEKIFLACPAKIEFILRHLSYQLRRLTIDFLNVCKEITETYNKK